MTTQDVITTMVRFLMASRGESQGALAKVLGMHQSSMSLKLSGRTRWSVDDLDVLAEHYGVPAHQLVEGTWNARDLAAPTQRLATGRYSTSRIDALSAYQLAA